MYELDEEDKRIGKSKTTRRRGQTCKMCGKKVKSTTAVSWELGGICPRCYTFSYFDDLEEEETKEQRNKSSGSIRNTPTQIFWDDLTVTYLKEIDYDGDRIT